MSQELARILTGVGIDFQLQGPRINSGGQLDYIRLGLFEFNPNRHDYSVKRFLGHTIEGHGFAEVEEALDILARTPPQPIMFLNGSRRFSSRTIRPRSGAADGENIPRHRWRYRGSSGSYVPVR